MRNTNIVRDAVKVVLTQNEAARNSDWVLIKEVLAFYVDTDSSLNEICDDAKDNMDIPSVETITRWRRKLQARYPELRACTKVIRYRKDREIEIKELMKGEC